MYLGNGVYCNIEYIDTRKFVTLTTQINGTIYLGAAEIKALLVWLDNQGFVKKMQDNRD